MKLPFATYCLLAHNFWSEAVKESLVLAAKYSKAGLADGFMRNVDDALDACIRSTDWLNNWKQEMKTA
jgi:hypothetical protein